MAQSNDNGYFYAVQMFGRPKSKSIQFQIENKTEATINYRIGDRTFPLPPRYSMSHEQCRPADVTFDWPEKDKQKSSTVHPDGGEKLVIVADESGEFEVKKE